MNEFNIMEPVEVIGYNPELADIGNPNGEIHGITLYISAEDSEGNRFLNKTSSRKLQDNDSYKESLTHYENRVREMAEWLNVNQPDLNMENWEKSYPSYGSLAYKEWERNRNSMEIFPLKYEKTYMG